MTYDMLRVEATIFLSLMSIDDRQVSEHIYECIYRMQYSNLSFILTITSYSV